MSGHEERDCSRQSEQQCERHGSQMISWIVATDKTLAEADRKALPNEVSSRSSEMEFY